MRPPSPEPITIASNSRAAMSGSLWATALNKFRLALWLTLMPLLETLVRGQHNATDHQKTQQDQRVDEDASERVARTEAEAVYVSAGYAEEK